METRKKLLFYMKLENMSLRRLAQYADVPVFYLKCYLKGTRAPRIDVLNRLAAALNVSVQDIFDERVKVGENIRFYRNKKMYSRQQLAELSCLSYSVIRRCELSTGDLPQEHLDKIAAALDVTAEKLQSEVDIDEIPIDDKEIVLHENTPLNIRIRYYRTTKKFTRKELGKLCGVTDMTIRNYEYGTTVPDEQRLEKLAAALGVTVKELLGKSLTCAKKQ